MRDEIEGEVIRSRNVVIVFQWRHLEGVLKLNKIEIEIEIVRERERRL